MPKIDIIAGARPNFMKIAPIIQAIHRHNENPDNSSIQYRLIHTGQHYDQKMSALFFDQLNIPKPHVNLEVGSGTQAVQTGQIMIRYEQILKEYNPDLCLVVGDVNSTMACAIVAKKAGIQLGHVEAGIRSRDIHMPEEINRIVTDSLCDYFFTTTERANKNLLIEGHTEDKIHFVGNTMIDTLLTNLNRIQKPVFFEEEGFHHNDYIVATLHRPSNVDSVEHLKAILDVIDKYSNNTRIVFPMHPRTRKIFAQIHASFDSLYITEPLGYLEFIYLIKNASGVITDSGGITEEATVLGIPCITMRDTTERPETVIMGTNEMVGTNPVNAIPYIQKMIAGHWKSGSIPPLWDGQSAKRIVEVLGKYIANRQTTQNT